MNEKLHRFFHCLMALILLVSTTSWTVGKHYCMGHLMDVSLFSHAEDCGMAMDSDNDIVNMQDEDSCCNDEVITIEGQDDLIISFNNISPAQQYFLVAFVHTYFNLFDTLAERPVPNEHYPPPLLIKDIQVLDSVFLI